MSRWKLLKDLPGCKAGTIATETCDGFASFDGIALYAERMRNNPDFFLRLTDEPKVECCRWRRGSTCDGTTHVKKIDGQVVDAVGSTVKIVIERDWKYDDAWLPIPPSEFDAAKAEWERQRAEASTPKAERCEIRYNSSGRGWFDKDGITYEIIVRGSVDSSETCTPHAVLFWEGE